MESNTTVSTTSIPAKLYLPSRRAGDLIYISGQLPIVNGHMLATGVVGDGEGDVSVDLAQQAAAAAARNCLRAVLEELDSLDDLEHVVKLNGFVASAPGFTGQPAVIDAASQVLLTELGERGRHARLAVGVAALPFGAPVEIELIVSARRVPRLEADET